MTTTTSCHKRRRPTHVRSLLLMASMVLAFQSNEADASSWRSSSTQPSSRKRVGTLGLLSIRGGESGFYELNPHYVPSDRQIQRQALFTSTSTPTLGELEESQYYPPPQQLQEDMYDAGAVFRIQQQHRPSSSGLERLQRYVASVHQLSPTLAGVSLVCIAIFILWQIPALQRGRILPRHFVCSRRNVLRQRVYSSLVLSALSHASFVHLLFNLVAFLSLGPAVKQSLRGWPLWPLVLGASVAGSLAYLLLTNPHYAGGCMGLSSVTLSLLSVYARLYPQNEIGLALFGILPVRLPAQYALYGMLAWSSVATLLVPKSRVAHSAHLGGLVFGMLYYEVWKQRFELRRVWKQRHIPFHG